MKARLLPALLLAASLSACAANPGPPPVEEAEPEPTPTTSSAAPTTTEVPSRRDKIITVGVDPLPAGFNPQLIVEPVHDIFIRDGSPFPDIGLTHLNSRDNLIQPFSCLLR